MIGDIDSGFFVTQMLGGSANVITGDYSRGAAASGSRGAKLPPILSAK